MGQFPLLTLRDILFSKTLSDKKIEIYIKECQKHNMQALVYSFRVWIEGIITEFHRIFVSHKIDILAKINSLLLLKQMVKICSYPILMLVETFLFSHLMDIAEYYARNPSFQKNSKYFQSIGHSPAYPNIYQLSHNYVVMGFQIMFICSMVRPKQNFQGQELRKNSSFFNGFHKIKEKNNKIVNQTQLKKKLFISQLRDKYKKQLQQFEIHSYFYIDHYMKKLEDFVFTTKMNPESDISDFRILLRRGDSFLTSQAVARLAQMIDFVNEFKIKTRALALLNEMILWGDVQAIITVNYTQYFQKIYRQLFKIDGSKGLQKGEQIFIDVKSHPQDKRRFYCDFLRCLQIWAEAFPHEYMIFYDKEESQIASPIFKNYRFLKEVRKFVFPQNLFLDKMKAEARLNFKQNQQRNKMIIDQLNKQINELEDFETVSFSEIQQKTETSERYLKKLKSNTVEGSVQSMMKHLIKFQNCFELELQRLTENIDESILDITIQRGLLCIEMVNIIQPEYDKFKKDKITLKDFICFCTKRIDFSRKSLTQISLNSSKSIQDRKSELKSSINSRINKQRSSIKDMTEQTRMKIIKAKYLERLQKMANRTSSQKDDSFLNTSLFLNKRNSQSLSKLPLQSAKRLDYKSPVNTQQVKSIHKTNHNIPKSPRQSGKKVFLVSKYLENQSTSDIQNLKKKIISQNWNSNRKILLQEVKHKEPSLVQINNQFSFVDQLHFCSQTEKQHAKKINKHSAQTSQRSKENKKFDSVKVADQIQSKSFQSSDLYQSPNFGNTQIRQETKDNSSNQDKKRFKKGVGLAKQFINLTQKLIGPKNHIISFADYADFFPNNQNTESKKETLSKQMTILHTELLQVDRVTISSDNKLIITFYLFPKENCERIRIKILQTPSIYLNVLQNKHIKVEKSYYQLKNLKKGQQYEFEIAGNVLKTPIVQPKIVIKVNQGQPQKFTVPFPLMHIIKFRRVDSKWLGKDFDLADKMVSETFIRNKEMLPSLDDIDDYISELTEIKAEKNLKRFMVECIFEKTNFVLEIKDGQQHKMSIQACALGQNCDKALIAFYIAECMNLFS